MRIPSRSSNRLLLLAAVSASLLLAQTPARSADPIETIGDIAVSQGPDSDRVFVTDPEKGVVLAFTWNQRQRPITSFSEFTLAFRATKLRRPTALAIQGNSLYVVDSAIPGVVAIDLTTQEERVIHVGPPLKRPTGLAVSASGLIAIADPAASAVIVLSTEGKRAPVVDNSFTEPLRVAFDSDDLLVLDRRGLSRGRVLGKWSSVFSSKLAPVQDIASYRGVYYVADDERLTTFVEKGSPTPIPSPGSTRSRFARIALRGSTLVAADFRQRVVMRINRPVPVTFRWNPVRSIKSSAEARELATSALTSSYEYLAKAGSLRFGPVTVAQPKRMDEWLVDQRVVLWPLGAPNRAGASEKAFMALQQLLCERNKELCDATRENLLLRQLSGSEIVWVPNLSVSASISMSEVELGGRLVEDHLRERVAVSEQRVQITDGNLAELNRDDRESLEIEMTRRGFVLATPALPALRPGALLRIQGGRDIPVGTVQAACGIELSVRPDAFPLRRILRTSNPNEYLPLRDLSRRKPDIRATDSEIEFPDLTIERIDAAGYERLRMLAGHPCLFREGSPDYVVTQVLSTPLARYRLLRDDKPLQLTTGDLIAWGVTGFPNLPQEWSIVVREQHGVAYRVVPLNGIGSASVEMAPLEIAQVKPQSPQNLFTRSKGAFVLPLSTWRFDALIPGDDLEPNSVLRAIEKTHPGLSISSPYSEPVRLTADVQSCGPEGPMTDATVRQRVQDGYQNLLKAIGYDEALARATTERIGIAERASTVDIDHPAFRSADGQSVWLQPDSLLGMTTRTARQPEPSDPKLRPFDLSQDHGTHVAGILAGQDPAMLGLIPDSSLFLIDVDGQVDDNLVSGVATAINAGVSVFSFSWEWPDSPQSLSNFKKALSERERWPEQLFIVSAGNSGEDLAQVGALPLASWITEHDNILGVGSASSDGKTVLGEWEENGATRKGSSVGSRYVHLVAPGRSVVSLAKGNAYTCATGSSTAAPQVAAAAAMLRTTGMTARQIKARLIATADWYPAFDKKVFGGELNIGRAGFHPQRHIYETHSGGDRRMSIVLRNASTVSVKNSSMLENGRVVDGPPEISTHDIMSLHLLKGSSYRAMVLVKGVLRAITGELSGRFSCLKLEQWNAKTNQFETSDMLRGQCRNGIAITDLKSYVARIPPDVRF